MSAIGIDFGNASSFVAVINSSGIKIIENDHRLRATPSYVSFCERNRVVGVAAKNVQLSNLQNTVFGFKRYLGLPFDNLRIQEDLPLLPFKIVKLGSGHGRVGIEVKYLGEDKIFTPEQLTAMLFTKLKETTENRLQAKVHNCVISVPSYFTDAERRALLDAAKIAGLHVLRLINDTTAAALNYGVSQKRNLPELDDVPRFIVIVDCGYSAFQISICALNKGKLRVITTNSDIDLGGRQLEAALLRHLMAEFPDQINLDKVRNNVGELRIHWFAEATALIRRMSESESELPLDITYTLTGEGKDEVERTISRATFEKVCATFFEDMEISLLQCLEDARLEVDHIHSVELIGGASRIPGIVRLVENVFGKAPSKTLDQDEAVALGCAMQCAILSPFHSSSSVVSWNYQVLDIQPCPINLHWKLPTGQIGATELYPSNYVIPCKTTSTVLCPLPKKTAFKVAYGFIELHPYKTIGKFIVDLNHEEDYPCMYTIMSSINIHGILSIDKATIVEQVGQKPGEKFSVMEITSDEEMEEPTTPPPSTNSEEIIHAPLEFRPTNGLPRSELAEMILEEGRLIALDKKEDERQEHRTHLEEYLQDLREKLDGDLKRFVGEGRNKLDEYLSDLEHWVYSEGRDKETEVFDTTLDELKEKIDPIMVRDALHRFGVTLSAARNFVYSFHARLPEYVHLDEKDVDNVTTAIERCETWLALDEQSSPPEVTSSDKEETQLRSQKIEEQRLIFDAKIRSILKTPSPN